MVKYCKSRLLELQGEGVVVQVVGNKRFGFVTDGIKKLNNPNFFGIIFLYL